MSEASSCNEIRGVINPYPYKLFRFSVVSNFLVDCPD